MSEMEQPPVYKIALGIEYDGSKYYGWQRQNEVRSVQEKLEKALSQVANEPVNVFARAVRMPAFTEPARSCILKRARSVRMPHGPRASMPIYPAISRFAG